MCFKNNYFFPIRFTSGGRVLLETACVRGCRGGDSDKNPFLDSPGQRKAGNVLEPEHWQKPWRFLFHPQTVFAFCEKWSTDMSQAKRLQCDILVCGAGPAGASAALAAASQGARVLVLEEREKEEASGKASGKTSDDAFALVPPYLLSKLPLEKTDDLVLRTTRHTSVYLDDRYEMSMSERMRVIRGDVLLQKLRETAEEHGTSLLWGHRLWRILDEHTAEVEGPDEKMLIIDAEVIIGAEGSYSPVGTAFAREGLPGRCQSCGPGSGLRSGTQTRWASSSRDSIPQALAGLFLAEILPALGYAAPARKRMRPPKGSRAFCSLWQPWAIFPGIYVASPA